MLTKYDGCYHRDFTVHEGKTMWRRQDLSLVPKIDLILLECIFFIAYIMSVEQKYWLAEMLVYLTTPQGLKMIGIF